MKKAWTALKEIEQRIARVAEAIRTAPKDPMHRHAFDPWPAQSRELTAIFMQPVGVSLAAVPDLSERRSTFYNGDVDELVIERLFAYVGTTGDASSVDPVLPMLGRAQDGFCGTDFSGYVGNNDDLTYPVSSFDFLWTYEVSSRGSVYSRNEFVSSDALMGMGDRGAGLEFRVPLRIPRGESIVFKVLPLYMDFRDAPSLAAFGVRSFNVNFVGLGHRRG